MGARFLDTCRGEVFCFCNKSGGWFVNYGINRNNSPYEKNNPHTDCYTYLFWCRLYCFLFSVGVHTQLVSCIGKTMMSSTRLGSNQYRTIPIHIQYLKGSYGTVDMGATMALIMLSILPVSIFYLCCQKHIIKGVAAGAVKG